LEFSYTMDPQTSNGLMFRQLETWTNSLRKIQIWNLNKNTKVEQRIMWSSSLSAWLHAQLLSQFSSDWFSEHLANSVCF
jgi:hypothetical protein